ncbi:MAG: hypothetical protein AAF513_03060 [Pseudomonadota bacterium]
MTEPQPLSPKPLPEDLELDFATRGLVLLEPEHLGLDPEVHSSLYAEQRALFRDKVVITTDNLPQITEILTAPGLSEACERLLGPRWAIVPYTHNAPFVSGAFDQHWHKDDNGPFNARRARHHQAVQVEMLYYPQAVTPVMGPTATLPYSQYWTYNHEENHDNFAGADHLDFAYQLEGMEHVAVSGPRSAYAADAVRDQTTAHDVRMRQAVTDTGWPHVAPYEAAPLKAGSVLMYSHNLFHRGNHRRDEFAEWRAQPRFMWRFWLYRTHNPSRRRHRPYRAAIRTPDALTKIDRTAAGDGEHATWRHHYAWLHGYSAEREVSALPALVDKLHLPGEEQEPQRIGAAYALALHPDRTEAARHLLAALLNERESIRRAGTYGLSALDAPFPSAELIDACRSANRWVRRGAVFVLGEAATLTTDVVAALIERLHNDPSVYVRSVAATSIGSLLRQLPELPPTQAEAFATDLTTALLTSLTHEANRLALDKAQGRSIKLVRPTDETDVCEGMGITYNHARFAPVRSNVRECVLTALVVLSSHSSARFASCHPALVDTLTAIAENEQNIFAAGLAYDALHRLTHAQHPDAHQEAAKQAGDKVRATLPLLCRASLCRTTI